jgi:Flp pilus assembly protein TadD
MNADSEQRINQALARAATSAEDAGEAAQSVGILEKLYNRSPKDEGLALRYASALRDAEYYNRALLVLAPFAENDKSDSAVKSEYASIQLALGNYPQAEHYAQKAILQNEKNAQAYQALGIALDAQNMYPEAERAYRKGLDNWTGDPTPIINNLALNLASQDYLEEAVELLQKAKAVSPDRPEVERNLRIIQALLDTKLMSHSPREGDRLKAKEKQDQNAKIILKPEDKVKVEPESEAEPEPKIEDDEPAAPVPAVKSKIPEKS